MVIRSVRYCLAGVLLLLCQLALAAQDSDDSDGSTGPDLAVAAQAIAEERFSEAIGLLQEAEREYPDNADVLNLLGYCHRKLDHYEPALDYYLRALAQDPQHKGANEYLGELYVELGQLDKAQERLAVLAKVCTDCEEYEDLQEAIAAKQP